MTYVTLWLLLLFGLPTLAYAHLSKPAVKRSPANDNRRRY